MAAVVAGEAIVAVAAAKAAVGYQHRRRHRVVPPSEAWEYDGLDCC
jgi:hypothetical protein